MTPRPSDGKQGVIRYRDLPIEHLFREYDYEDVMHLIIWGQLPSEKEKRYARIVMGEATTPPQSVVDVISAFPFVLQPALMTVQKFLLNVIAGVIQTPTLSSSPD